MMRLTDGRRVYGPLRQGAGPFSAGGWWWAVAGGPDVWQSGCEPTYMAAEAALWATAGGVGVARVL